MVGYNISAIENVLSTQSNLTENVIVLSSNYMVLPAWSLSTIPMVKDTGAN